jgi:hypothetical protein
MMRSVKPLPAAAAASGANIKKPIARVGRIIKLPCLVGEFRQKPAEVMSPAARTCRGEWNACLRASCTLHVMRPRLLHPRRSTNFCRIFPGARNHPWSTCAWRQSYACTRGEFKPWRILSAADASRRPDLPFDVGGSIRARERTHRWRSIAM